MSENYAEKARKDAKAANENWERAAKDLAVKFDEAEAKGFATAKEIRRMRFLVRRMMIKSRVHFFDCPDQAQRLDDPILKIIESIDAYDVDNPVDDGSPPRNPELSNIREQLNHTFPTSLKGMVAALKHSLAKIDDPVIHNVYQTLATAAGESIELFLPPVTMPVACAEASRAWIQYQAYFKQDDCDDDESSRLCDVYFNHLERILNTEITGSSDAADVAATIELLAASSEEEDQKFEVFECPDTAKLGLKLSNWCAANLKERCGHPYSKSA